MGFRLRAFFLHALISLLFASAALILIFIVWYPSPLHNAVGVSSIVLLLLGVDVTLGPVLTLILAKQGKRGLLFDLIVIALLQISAFGYGLFVVAEGRPVWIVFNNDRFDLVRAHDLQNPYREKASAAYRRLSFSGPVWVAAQSPEDSNNRNTLLMESIVAGVDLPQRPDLYFPYSDAADQVREKSQSLSELYKYNHIDQVKKILSLWPEADAFLPMMAPVKPMAVLVNKKSAQVVAVVELNPWY